MPQRFLRVTSVPPGEAPLWVRQHWVGLLLPLAQRSNSQSTYLVFGVLSGPRTLLACLGAILKREYKTHSGYAVDAARAVALLEEVSPYAAGWWRQNTPQLVKPGMKFVFDQNSGHVSEATS